MSSDGNIGYRIILTTSTKYYDDYCEYSPYAARERVHPSGNAAELHKIVKSQDEGAAGQPSARRARQQVGELIPG